MLFFWSFTAAECSYHIFIIGEASYLLTVRITPDITNSLWFLHGMKELLQAILCILEVTFGI